MRLLLFSDLHCDASAASRLVRHSRDVDVVVGAGDFGNVRQQLDTAIGFLRAIERPSILVPGNAESVEELTEACRVWPSAHVLHGNGVELDGVAFYGLGGGVPVTPFGAWSYDFTEDQATQLLQECPEDAVLVTHSPPHGAVDTDSGGRHLGSTAIRDTVLTKKPRLLVCGHIHACGSQDVLLGKTPVVNAGPAGVVWEI
jgi:Icc-related predicted phosphoesterase